MMHLGRGPELHPVSAGSLRHALFDRGPLTVQPVDAFSDYQLDWGDPANLRAASPLEPGGHWL
jgi:muramoyltetrapeptide carboxypeptidase LdcA involved in peptidoglycan recycling